MRVVEDNISASNVQIRSVIINATVTVNITKSAQIFIAYFLSLAQMMKRPYPSPLNSRELLSQGRGAEDTEGSLFMSQHM